MNSENSKEKLVQLSNTSTTALANKMAQLSLTILCSVLSIAYVVEALKHSRTWGYVAVVVGLSMLPSILGWILYGIAKDHKALKYVVIIGFALLYSFVLFTAANDLVFTYALPMLVITTLYLNKKYTLFAGIGAAVLNIADVVRKLIQNPSATEKLPMYEIQAILVVLFVIYVVMTISTSLKFQEIHGAKVLLEKEKAKDMLDRTLTISSSMTEDIERVVGQMSELSEAVENTLSAMEEVQSGAVETAESVQKQLQQTEEIQNRASEVESASDVIKQNIETTSQAVAAGQKCMEEMAKLSDLAIETSNRVSSVLEEFRSSMEKMNEITELINLVADQTGLLALNASIEAARAGDAGRGFAVVASEISSLAGQTSNATGSIGALINDINSQLTNMIAAVDNMLEDNKHQVEATRHADETFATIVSSIDEICRQSEVLGENVVKLADANGVIVDSVTTISAISEEVSAHANYTYESSQRNREIVNAVGSLVTALDNNAKVLAESSSDQ